MTIITTGNHLVTLINVFTVQLEHQQRLIDLLATATEQTMRHQTGYISANIHKSLDGTKVTNYAQWRSQADFEAMLHHPDAVEHMTAAAELAQSFEPYLYDVSFIDEVT